MQGVYARRIPSLCKQGYAVLIPCAFAACYKVNPASHVRLIINSNTSVSRLCNNFAALWVQDIMQALKAPAVIQVCCACEVQMHDGGGSER